MILPTFAYGQEGAENDLPKIVSHSRAGNSVYIGDKVQLMVNVDGKNLFYRWIKQNKTVCEQEKCDFDTADWAIDKHVITAIAYNEKGSQEVRFLIRVLARPEGKRTKMRTVVPDLVAFVNKEVIKEDDFSVVSLMGIGYSYHRNKVQVIAQTPRLLEWAEKIKSHTKGVTKFGRKDEEHVVLQGGTVALAKSDSGRRLIRILQGALRSRQLKNAETGWSIVVDDWLQIETDSIGDVIIFRQGIEDVSAVSIAVMRGNANVRYRVQLVEGADKVEFKQVVVPAGGQIDIKKNETPSMLMKPENKMVSNVFVFSSPQYLYEKELQKNQGGSFLSDNIEELKKMDVEDAVKAAEENLKGHDYLLSLENLLPVYRKGQKDYAFMMALARSYQGLGLLKYANQIYLLASKIKPEEGAPYYQIGLMYTESRNWAKAIKFFELAEDYEYEDTQALNYYMGVAKFNTGSMLSARNYFRYSMWQPDNTELYISAQKFLTLIGDEKPYGAIGYLGFGKDSNVYRLPLDIERTEEYETKSSNYYHGYGKLYYNGYSSDDGFLQFLFDAEKFGYLNSDLKDIEILTQRIMADWAIKILGEDPKDLKPSFELNFTPYLKLVTIGEKRAADSYGFKFGAGLPATVLAPRLIFEYVSILDPFPTELDKFDPIRFEPSTIAADRSGNLTSYGLGFMFMQETTFHLGLEAISSSLKHKDELVNYDDFSGLDVRLFGENRLQPWLVGILNLGYGNRSFPDSPDTRKDTFTLGGLTLRYFITPNFYNDLRINYKDQKSNREYSVYKRYEAGLYLTLEL